MNCYRHHEASAVAQCQHCSTGLCPVCSSRFTLQLCQNCLLANNQRYKASLIKNSIIMSVVFFATFWIYYQLGQGTDLFRAFLYSLFWACAPWGWSALNRLTPQMFLFLPVIGWLIYFFVKFWISAIIGVFMAPFQVFKYIRDTKMMEEVKEGIRSGTL